MTLAEASADPYPDLTTYDSDLWRRLLSMVWLDHGDAGNTVYVALHCMRCCGASIETTDRGYMIKPVLSKSTNDLNGDIEHRDTQWQTEADYRADANTMLLPHKDEVKRYLRKLYDEDDVDL